MNGQRVKFRTRPRVRRPPGAQRLQSAGPLAGEFQNALFVFIGNDAWVWWRDADQRGDPCLCVAPDEHPGDYDWGACRHRDVLLVQCGLCGDPTVRELAERIALAGPRTLVVAADCVHPERNDGTLFLMPMVRLI